MNKKVILKIVYSAVCLSLALVLPFLTGQVPTIGNALSPMHIPVLLCGFICGWKYGLVVGLIAPLLRSGIFGMPPFYPTALAMSFELAAYGAFSGLMYQLLPKKSIFIYVSLIISMILGRVVWGFTRMIMAGLDATEFTFKMFLSGAILNAVPGIILHIVLIPVLVFALKKAKLGIEND